MSDLIEEFGGYEASKNILLRKRYDHVAYSVDSNSFYDHEAAEHGGIDVRDLDDALLEYRREHNIFEVGDCVVKTDPKIKHAHVRVVISTSPSGGAVLDYQGFPYKFPCVRHATDAEIKAGRRL